MVVAGSINYTGAVHLAGLAAYRTGAGLVTLAVIPSLQALLAAGLVETTWLLLPEQLGVVSPNALPVLADNLDGYRALLVGPGLSQEQEAVRFVHGLLGVSGERKRPAGFLGGQAGKTAGNDEPPRDKETAAQDQDEGDSGSAMGFLARHRSWATHSATEAIREMPLVLDADALNALSQVDDWHQAAQLPANSVLTPHPGEMGRLCGCSTREVQADRLGLARSKAAEWQQVVLLKGAYTVIAAPDGRVAVLPFANPALATAGSGDVLSGTILGLLSQGMAGFEAAVLGGYLHGLAGELARSEIGEAGVVAGDLLDRLPRAIRHLRAA
jgi:NAD(P)H-hydrate epimerase